MKKIVSNNNGLLVDEFSKTKEIRLYNLVKNKSKYDVVNLYFISELVSDSTLNLNKNDFSIRKSQLFSPIFSTNVNNYANYNILRFNVKYILDSYIPQINEEEIINLFNEYNIKQKLNKDLFNNLKKDYLNDILYLKSNHDHLAKRLLEDNCKLNYLSLEEEEVFVKELKFEDLEEFYSNMNIDYKFKLMSSNKVESINTESRVDLVKNYDIKSFENKEYNFNLEQASIKLLLTTNSDIEDYKAQIISYILGGDALSYLFLNVREKHQLAYSTYCYNLNKKNIVISIQTKKETIEDAINISLSQVDLMQDISQKDFENSKQRLITAIIKNSKDKEINFEHLKNEIMFNEPYNLEDKISNIKNYNLEEFKADLLKYKDSGRVVVL